MGQKIKAYVCVCTWRGGKAAAAEAKEWQSDQDAVSKSVHGSVSELNDCQAENIHFLKKVYGSFLQ